MPTNSPVKAYKTKKRPNYDALMAQLVSEGYEVPWIDFSFHVFAYNVVVANPNDKPHVAVISDSRFRHLYPDVPVENFTKRIPQD